MSISEFSYKSYQTESTVAKLYNASKHKFQSTCSDLPWYHSINNALSKLEQFIFAFTIVLQNRVVIAISTSLQNHPTVILLLLKVFSILNQLPFISQYSIVLTNTLKRIYK